ncbi:MAG: hypothetical protein ACPGVO_18410 [Spirulinaceae cyanobacterium]
MQVSKNPPARLHLAPQLKCPLSLWNPLDYLRLLYWIGYFPQAFRWYIETFSQSDETQKSMSLRKRFVSVWGDRLQRRLWLQISLMTVVVNGGILSGAIQFGADLPDWFMILMPIWIAVALPLGLIIAFPRFLVGSFEFTSCLTLLVVLTEGIPDHVSEALWESLPLSVFFGASIGLFSGLLLSITATTSSRFQTTIPVDFLDHQFQSLFIKFYVGIPGGILSAIVSFCTVKLDPWLAWRPDAWLLGKVFRSQTLQQSQIISHVSVFPEESLTTTLERRLQTDWLTGLQDCHEVLRYSLQFIPVLTAIDRTLITGPDAHLLWRMAQLTEQPLGWQLTGYTATGLAAALEPRPKFLSLPRIPKLTDKAVLNITPETCRWDTPIRAAASGFWLLHEQQPAAALKAFWELRTLSYGQELYALCLVLELCQKTPDLSALLSLKLPRCPEPDPTKRLRAMSWRAIAYFDHAIHEIRLAHESGGAYSLADANHQARLAFQQVIELEPKLPVAERKLITQAAKTWLKNLVQAVEL